MATEADTNQNPTDGNPPADQNNGGEQNGDTPKTFTQEDVDKIIAKRVGEVSSKTDEIVAKKLKEERSEWERQAKLTAEQKAAEETEKQKQELDKRAHEVALGERRIDVHRIFSEKSLPTSFIDWVIDVDEGKTNDNIERFEKDWAKAVEEGVKSKIEGTTPTDKSHKPTRNTGSGHDNGQGVSSF